VAWRSNNAGDGLHFAGTMGITLPFSVWAWAKTNPSTSFGVVLSLTDDTAALEVHRCTLESGTARATSRAAGAASSAISANTYIDGLWNGMFYRFLSTTSRSVSLNGGAIVTSTTNRNPTGLVSTRIGSQFTGAVLNGNIGIDVGTVTVWSGDMEAHIPRLYAGVNPATIAPESILAHLDLEGPNCIKHGPLTVNSGSANSGCFIPPPVHVSPWRDRARVRRAA